MSSTNRGGQRDALDRYYTPEPLAAACVGLLPSLRGVRVVEPSVGGGAFARALTARGADVLGCDIDPDAAGRTDVRRFRLGSALEWSERAGWYVGNPPYGDAQAHVEHALSYASIGVAFLLRLAFLESKRRYPFWSENPASDVYVFSRRPSFTDDGRSDSCAYGWFVWMHGDPGMRLHVLGPSFGRAG